MNEELKSLEMLKVCVFNIIAGNSEALSLYQDKSPKGLVFWSVKPSVVN